jgi:arylsulfatase A-like enzyme
MPLPESIGDEMEDSPYFYRKLRTSEMYSDPEKIQYFVSEYYAMVKEVDDWVGNILDYLDESGLSENTLVVFTSDHGEMLGSHGMRGKFNFYEESAHIPLILKFPGKIKAGTVVESYVSTINLFATILDYLETSVHESDGYSLRGLIEGTDHINGKYVVSEWLSELKTAPSHMVLKDGWKLMLPDSSTRNVMKALYDLNSDPWELNNLLGNNPDSANYHDKVVELEACFQEWITRTEQNKTKLTEKN